MVGIQRRRFWCNKKSDSIQDTWRAVSNSRRSRNSFLEKKKRNVYGIGLIILLVQSVCSASDIKESILKLEAKNIVLSNEKRLSYVLIDTLINGR
jgi:hypothetical protein